MVARPRARMRPFYNTRAKRAGVPPLRGGKPKEKIEDLE